VSGQSSEKAFLEKEGWTRRFVACEPRLGEAVELYRESGFEVHLEPLTGYEECPDHDGEAHSEDECRICFKGFEDQYRVI
jgi:hypothetical protein